MAAGYYNTIFHIARQFSSLGDIRLQCSVFVGLISSVPLTLLSGESARIGRIL